MDIHRSNRAEKIPTRVNSYKSVYASATEATVWHFRRIKDLYRVDKTMETSALEEVADKWKANFQTRLQHGKLSKLPRCKTD